jgi:hypothetical protein
VNKCRSQFDRVFNVVISFQTLLSPRLSLRPRHQGIQDYSKLPHTFFPNIGLLAAILVGKIL